ncbi:HNH/endonuclease VII fold putative polymorphic toxin, partial [Pseudomonas citronellolis]
FLTPDPIKLAGGLNHYQYVPNPTGWVDPLGLVSENVQCPSSLKWKRPDKYFESRQAALRAAKADARVPVSAEPVKVGRVPLEESGRMLLDSNGVPIMTREYHYTNIDGTRVVIQEHSRGHKEFSEESAAGKPHFNVREYDEATGNAARTKTLYLKSVAGHYVFE